MNENIENPLAEIEYSGISGISANCKHAVMRYLQYGDEVTLARILSSGNIHCILLTVNGDLVGIKSGFSSGYAGEGPRTFSYIIQLLESYGVELEEYEVDEEFIKRLDRSALTHNDLNYLETSKPIRPTRLYEYAWDDRRSKERLWERFPSIIPFAIIDGRIIDLAISFWKNPDNHLLTGYRRLEDIVRKRTKIDEHGQKLFSRAFSEKDPILGWNDIDGGERTGRVNLFTGAYMAYRNPRAHRETNEYSHEQLTEFLLLNHLFILESKSINLSKEAKSSKE